MKIKKKKKNLPASFIMDGLDCILAGLAVGSYTAVYKQLAKFLHVGLAHIPICPRVLQWKPGTLYFRHLLNLSLIHRRSDDPLADRGW